MRPEKSSSPQPVADRLCLQGILYVLHNDIAWQLMRPHRRPDSLLGDKGYGSNPHREELRKRRPFRSSPA